MIILHGMICRCVHNRFLSASHMQYGSIVTHSIMDLYKKLPEFVP